MGHKQHHRGAHPEDADLFGTAALPVLQRAVGEIAWLLDRGYPLSAVLTLVGNHYRLAARQRLALQRGCCGAAVCASRRARSWKPAEVRGNVVHIDGFNVLITLEVALGGGVLIESLDGTLRDLAGLRGSYHMVAETDLALDRLSEFLEGLYPARVEWYLDSPVSNSGRLRERILEHAAKCSVETRVTLVADPDAVLTGRTAVASSDSAVLDRCESWINLAAWLIQQTVSSPWRIPLAPL